jgi:hypothetical protein
VTPKVVLTSLDLANPDHGADAAAPGTATAETKTPTMALEDLQTQFAKVGLPVGWTSADFARLKGIANLDDSDAMISGVNKLLGLLMTTLALSMGGPFWFDMLNKLVTVGTAGQRPVKTKDDPAKAST